MGDFVWPQFEAEPAAISNEVHQTQSGKQLNIVGRSTYNPSRRPIL